MDIPTSNFYLPTMGENKKVHFSDHDLYSVIKNNDVAGVEKAVFFMGARIHVVHIWCGRTALEYAARLGHLEQTEILFRDLERYFDINFKPKDIVGKIFKELIPYSGNCSEFMSRLVDENEEECVNQLIDIIRAEAFQLLETLARKNEKYIACGFILCFDHGKAQIFRASEWLVKHPVFVKTLEAWRKSDPLHTAIMQSDYAEFRRLLLSVDPDSDPPQYKSFENITESRSSLLQELCTYEKRRKLEQANTDPEFLHHLVGTDDVAMLDTLLESDVLSQVLRITKLTEEKQLLILFNISLRKESLNIAQKILEHQEFRSDVDWHRLYFEMVEIDKIKAAEFAKSRCGYINQHAKGQLYQKFGNVPILMESLNIGSQPARVVTSLVNTIDCLPRNIPDSSSTCYWRRAVNHFPWANGRPDLVESFAKYGFKRSQKEVIQNMADRSCQDFDEDWDEQTPDAHFYSESANKDNLRQWRRTFLSEGGVRVSSVLRIKASFSTAEHSRSTLLECAIQTCTPIKTSEPVPYVVAWRVDRMQRVHVNYSPEALEATRNMVQEIESKRLESMSLKILCRIVIRRQIRSRNMECDRGGKFKTSLTFALQCLYVDGHLPRDIVKFLLYREEHVRQPLYYRLVKPVYSHIYGGQYGLYEPDPVVSDDDDDYYYSSSDEW